MTQRILRWTVPVDDASHSIGAGSVTHVAVRHPGQVEVWTVEPTPEDWPLSESKRRRTVRVVGTGHPIPDHWTALGSAIDGSFVWHVCEHPQSEPELG